MCGICGQVGTAPGEMVDEDLLRRMADTLAHRGPDDEGYFTDGLIGLGMRRLSIIDPATGRQPVANETGTIRAVFNGEIYNHVELRRDLERRGHRFRSHHSDSETIVHLYEEFGEDWPERAQVNGMFAVALWDASCRRLLLYRDRIGKKPLYYAILGRRLVFASECKAILAHPDVSRELDHHALWHYFTLKNVSAPFSAWRAIRRLPAGCRLVWEDGAVWIDRWWRPSFVPRGVLPPDEAAAEVTRLLDDAVRLRTRSDVPYGVLLSGGLDSSSVAALACRHAGQRLSSFCLAYADDPAEGEQFAGKAADREWARRMAARLGTDHHEFRISAESFAAGLPTVMGAFDEPFSGTISTFYLSAEVRRHVNVALTGDGADELFGSYLPHRLALPISRYCAMGRPPREDLDAAALALLKPFDAPAGFARLAALAADDQPRWRMKLAVFSEAEKCELLPPGFLDTQGQVDTQGLYAALAEDATAEDPLNAALEFDQRELLPNQVLTFADSLSMAHSLELRSPYLDHRLVAFVNGLPGALKICGGVVKALQKAAMRDLLPEALIIRPKEGFVQPIYSWMNGKLRPWVESVLAPARLRRHGLLRSDTVSRLLGEHFAGHTDNGAKIWNLACFQIWYDSVVEGRH